MPQPLYTRKSAPGTQWIDRRLGGPQSSLDAVVKRKIPSPYKELNPKTPIVWPVASLMKHMPILYSNSAFSSGQSYSALFKKENYFKQDISKKQIFWHKDKHTV
jgi:hypothetical protein